MRALWCWLEISFSSHCPQTTVYFWGDLQNFFILKAEILPGHSIPHSHFTCELLPQFPLWKCCCYYRISLSLPLFEENSLPIRLPSRSCCHFLFLSCLLQSSHQLLCFFFLFFPQSCCSLPEWVKPGVSFPHLPPFSNRTSSDMWLPLPLLPMCVFCLGLTLYYSQTWPGCLANSSGLEHSSESLFPGSSQHSFLCFQELFFYKVSCPIWHILNFSPLALVLLHQPPHLISQQKCFTWNSQVFPACTELALMSVLQHLVSANEELSSHEQLLGVVLDV